MPQPQLVSVAFIERTIQYIKDRTECFDDYFPCRKNKCKPKHMENWFNLFVDHYNREVISTLQSRHAAKEVMNHNTQSL